MADKLNESGMNNVNGGYGDNTTYDFRVGEVYTDSIYIYRIAINVSHVGELFNVPVWRHRPDEDEAAIMITVKVMDLLRYTKL